MDDDKKRRAKGEGTIFYSESKRLYVSRVELSPGLDGKRRRLEVSGKSHNDVLAKLRKLNAQKDKYGGHLPVSTWTVQQWGDYWVKAMVNGYRRPTTAIRYARALANHVYPAIGKTKLSKMTPGHVRKVLATMPDGAPIVGFTFAVMRVMFRDAVREGLMAVSPCAAVAQPKQRRPKLRVLEPEQSREVLRKILDRPDAVLWALYLVMGARRAEVAGLTWDRVTDESIEIAQQVVRKPVDYDWPKDMDVTHLRSSLWLAPTKTAAGRRLIPNVEPFRSLLQQWRADAPTNRWNLVFTETGRDGSQIPLAPDRVTRLWLDMRDALGASGVRLHDLRHGAIDVLFMLGVPEHIIIEIVGHSSYAQSRAYKSARDYGPRREAMRAVGSFLSGSLTSANDSSSAGDAEPDVASQQH